ncbi:hypothetical protein DER46DRAFT_579711 [Fusarium sp. MPI-SDFR-AT-0072]|nr:hypothetical protein DER46DRAFT_579711 [Fusarium sp. MPI-SDFR-AT-0072]
MISIAVVDGGPEIKKELPRVLNLYGVRWIETSPYNPKGNGLNKYRHNVLRRVLEKLQHKGKNAYLPFYLMHGWEPAYPLEVEYPTWRLINWNEVHTPEERLQARIRILEIKGADVEKAKVKVAEY